MKKPIQEMCQEWRAHPCTKYLLEFIETYIGDLEVGFSSGTYVSDTEFKTIKAVLRAHGMCEALEVVYGEVDRMATPVEEDIDDNS